LLSYQMLFISLTLSLFLMVNRRLSGALQEDIARRERTEEELRRSEEKFALAFQGNPDAITLTSIEDGTIFDVNESFTRIVGYSRDEAIGRTTVDLNFWGNPADRTTFVELLRSEGHPRNVEMVFRKKSGELLTGQISGEVLRLRQGACVLSIIQDITEQRMSETSLQEARETAEKYLNVAAEVILGLDVHGNITLLNDSGHRLLGYAPGELIGKNWFETCLPEEVKTEAHGVFAKLMAGEYSDVLTYENAVITREGTKLSLLWHNTLLRDADGRVVGALSSAEDITERKRVQEVLQESEEKFRNVFELSPLGRSITGVDGSLHVNRAFADMLGYSQEELERVNWKDVTHPDDVEQSADLVRSLLSGTAETMSLEKRYIHKNGSIVWTEVVTFLARDSAGNPRFFLTSVQDITERKKLEREVAHLASFPAQNPYAVLEIGTDGAMRYANAAAMATLERLGLDADARQFLPGTPEELAVLRSQCEQNPQTQELPLGGATFLRVVAAPPGETSLRAYAVDITERRRAEEALAESEKKLRTLFETMSEGIVYEDHDGTIISANPAAERLLGLSLDQMQGRTSLDPRWKAIHEDGSPFPGETHSLRLAAKTGKPGHDEIQGIYNPHLSAYTWLSINSTPEFLPGEKEPFRAYAVFRDITERKRAEEEIRTLNTELEERVRRRTAELSAANKELEAFSYSVSHDLRAPLRSIDGFSQAFLEDYGASVPGEGREDLERVRRATQRMGQLIDDMLLLSRVTRSQMHAQKIDLSALASEVADELAQENPQRDVQLAIEPGLTATGDPRLLRIVLVNLLDNAWKFTSKQAQAHIAMATVNNPERGRVFFVRDDGVGFDPRYKGKSFGVICLQGKAQTQLIDTRILDKMGPEPFKHETTRV
ncbi:MAG: PAS domain S-box protein, partial [Caldiserica bacterium]|nr:PAS domain S-box protein [Caldisericota bacterium]